MPVRRCGAGCPAPRRWSPGQNRRGRDWDRRLRPMLARQFELASGQRKAKDPRAFHATGRMLFGEQLWQWVDPDNISRDRWPASPVPVARRSTTSCNGWSNYDHPGAADRRPLRSGARRDRPRRGRQAPRRSTLILITVLAARARPDRGSAGPRQDPDRQVFRRGAGAGVHPGAVHPRPAARRPARLDDLRHAVGPLRVPPRPDLHQPAAGRRDQPNAAQDPGRAAGGDGRTPGQHRRRHPPAAGAVHRAGHRQPDRVRGHLPAARGAAGPVRDQAGAAVPVRAGRGRDAAAPPRPRIGRSRGQPGRRRPRPAGHAGVGRAGDRAR